MNMLAKVGTVDPTSSMSPTTSNLQLPEQETQARPGFDSVLLLAPCVPLSDTQMRDYLDLMFSADERLATGREQEANRVKRVATNILRTGAPALE